jgi:hypothetical protein
MQFVCSDMPYSFTAALIESTFPPAPARCEPLSISSGVNSVLLPTSFNQDQLMSPFGGLSLANNINEVKRNVLIPTRPAITGFDTTTVPMGYYRVGVFAKYSVELNSFHLQIDSINARAHLARHFNGRKLTRVAHFVIDLFCFQATCEYLFWALLGW